MRKKATMDRGKPLPRFHDTIWTTGFLIPSTCLLGLLMSGLAFSQGAEPMPQISLLPWATGFERPVYVTHAGDGSGRLFVVEQGGRILLVSQGQAVHSTFLDISDRVSCCGERGLLSVAFPPGFAGKNYFYVDYTDLSGGTVVSRFHLVPGGDMGDPASEEILLQIHQPFANHNGGQLAFGPDGYLYIGTGDGGSGGDPLNNGQNLSVLLGKILRIDVESGRQTYIVPRSNPFIIDLEARSEIWAYGLRNPWRFSFDRLTGDLYVADVGQNRIEEVDFQAASSGGGENYGWKIMEGPECFGAPSCNQEGLVLPVAFYEHSPAQGCAVTGGYVYRGPSCPTFQGTYLYGDYCSGVIWGVRRDSVSWQSGPLLDSTLSISSFGEDEAGEIYVLDLGGGALYQVRAQLPLMPDVKANGLDGPVEVNALETVSVTVNLGPAGMLNQTAEWWLAAETAQGFFYYVYPSGWQTAFQPAFVGLVGPVTSYEVYKGVLLPGRYTIYFALDPIVDDTPQVTWLDAVVVDVR
jgi:glucose/arabinose dehydrogenase